MILAEQLCKQYVMGESVVHALDRVDLTIESGEFISITGASGSGKSTLMHILGLLDRPSSGTLSFQGQTISSLNEKQLARIRNRHVGFVFQTFNLINRSSALENVVVPMVYTRQAFNRRTAIEALERVGLGHRFKHTPAEMSGGECQRVAIARAIVNQPDLILADEPTGNLDSKTGEQIMSIFRELHDCGITIILVTHEMDVAVQANRTIRMHDGHIVEDKPVDSQFRAQILQAATDPRPAAPAHRETSTAAPHEGISPPASYEPT